MKTNKRKYLQVDEDLIQSAEEGNLGRVRELLRMGACVNATDEHGYTSLMLAIEDCHLNVVRELMKLDNLDVNAKAHDGVTALIVASNVGHCDVLLKLVKCDTIDVNA